MSISQTYAKLKAIALAEFRDIVDDAQVMTLPTGDPLKLRLDVVDGSLIDVFLSASGKYSYHWERRLTAAGDLYRHDNAPHGKWRAVATFPKHFHNGSEDNVGKAISATFLSKHCVSSSHSHEPNCLTSPEPDRSLLAGVSATPSAKPAPRSPSIEVTRPGLGWTRHLSLCPIWVEPPRQPGRQKLTTI